MPLDLASYTYESFDVGETFSGVDFETGLEVVEELRSLVPADATLAQLALRWILDFEAVSTVEPRLRNLSILVIYED